MACLSLISFLEFYATFSSSSKIETRDSVTVRAGLPISLPPDWGVLVQLPKTAVTRGLPLASILPEMLFL